MNGFGAFQSPNSCFSLRLECGGVEVADRRELRRLRTEEVVMEAARICSRVTALMLATPSSTEST